jgi:hypothetical protein
VETFFFFTPFFYAGSLIVTAQFGTPYSTSSSSTEAWNVKPSSQASLRCEYFLSKEKTKSRRRGNSVDLYKEGIVLDQKIQSGMRTCVFFSNHLDPIA